MCKSGFVVGETININLQVSNRTSCSISTIKVKLLKEIEYSSQEPYEKTRLDTTTMEKIELQRVGANEVKNFDAALKIQNNFDVLNYAPSSIIKFRPKIAVS